MTEMFSRRVLSRIGAWPLAVKVPLIVACLMVGIAVMISQVVLSRLVKDQETNLSLLTSAYLDGISAAVTPSVLRADVWETFDALDRARTRYAGVDARYALVELPNHTILAASDPVRFPIQSRLPAELERHFPQKDGLIIDSHMGRAWLARTLREEGFSVGRILAEIDIADLLRIRHDVLLTLVLVNGALTIAFAFAGYLLLKQMLQPLGVLSLYVERARDGNVQAIPERHRRRLSREFDRLFSRFNAMATALAERETLASRLAEQEKYAMLGKLASGMAHEVNNPLGGMLNAIDTIQAHGQDAEVRLKSVEFLKRGLSSIRSVVRAALVTYKADADISVLTPNDLDDLPFLIQHEAGARRLRLDWQNQVTEPVAVEATAIRQITLNLLLNACAASPDAGTVSFLARKSQSNIQIAIADEGSGIPADILAILDRAEEVSSPPPASKGLGLWTTARLVHRLGGCIDVDTLRVGTRVRVTIPLRPEKIAA